MAFGADILVLDMVAARATHCTCLVAALKSTHEQWPSLTILLPIALASWFYVML